MSPIILCKIWNFFLPFLDSYEGRVVLKKRNELGICLNLSFSPSSPFDSANKQILINIMLLVSNVSFNLLVSLNSKIHSNTHGFQLYLLWCYISFKIVAEINVSTVADWQIQPCLEFWVQILLVELLCYKKFYIILEVHCYGSKKKKTNLNSKTPKTR